MWRTFAGEGVAGSAALASLTEQPAGKASAVAELLRLGVGQPIKPAVFNDVRKAYTPSHRPLLDLQTVFNAALQSVVAPESIVHTAATLHDVVNHPNVNGITPLHAAAGGHVGTQSLSDCAPVAGGNCAERCRAFPYVRVVVAQRSTR